MPLYATNRFTGDGVTTEYEFNFLGKYIDRAHVKAYIEDDTTGARTPVPLTDSNFLNDTTLKNLPTTPVGSTLVIYRDTPRYPLVDFSSGSRITEESLDAVARQGIFVAAEAADAGDLGANPPSIVNVGVGHKLVAGEAAGVTRMRTLAAGTNIGITETPELLVISSTSSGSSDSTPLRVAVIGDSLSAQQVLLGEAWPAVLQRQLAAGGYDALVHNLAINGHTFNKAATIQSFNGRTQVAQAIDLNPDVVIVALGINDALLKVEGRSLNTLKVDAANVFASLRTNLPSATIVYASEVAYDSTHGLAASLLNKQTIPFLMQRRSTGLLAGVACSEILDDATSAITRQRLADWAELDTYIKGLATIDGNFAMHVWRASRLGLSGTDGLHLTDMGAHFLAGQARKAFTTVPALNSKAPWLSDQNYVWFMDSDNLFSSLVESTGTEYIGRPWTANSEHAVRNHGPYRVCNPHTWYLPSKGAYFSANTAYVQGTPFSWSLRNVAPATVVQGSVDGGAWVNIGTTDSYGDFNTVAVLDNSAFPVGPHTVMYRVGDEVHGPVTISVSAGSSGGGGGGSSFGFINVKDAPFNVKGDGSNETVAIQAALNHAASNNLSVYFPNGNYIAAGLTYTATSAAHIVVFGDGSGNTTLAAPNGTASPILTIGSGGTSIGPNQLRFEGLTFRGNYPGTYQSSNTAYTQSALLIDTANHLLFDDCRWYNAVNGMRVVNGVITHVERCGAWYNEIGINVSTPGVANAGTTTFLDKTDVKNNHLWGVYFDHGRMLTMDSCTVEGNGGNGAGASGGVGTGVNIGSENGAGFNAIGVVIKNTWFEANAGSAAVYLRSGSNTVEDCTFTATPTSSMIYVDGGRYFLNRLRFENDKPYNIYEFAAANVLAGNLISSCYVGGTSNTPATVMYDSAKTALNFALPKATASVLGGVKVGGGISVAADGTISTEGAWQPLSLTGGHTWWAGNTGYYRKSGTRIEFKGAVQLSTSGPVSNAQLTTVLPADCRPPSGTIVGMAAAGGGTRAAAITLAPSDGTLRGSVDALAGTNGVIFLDGCSFSTV